MALQINKNDQVCERLKALGYEHRKSIRMYGEEFDLASNPVPDGNGFAIEAISRKSGSTRMVRIPLSVLQMITNDLEETVSSRAA